MTTTSSSSNFYIDTCFATFCARTCYTLWHGAPLSSSSPTSSSSSTPSSTSTNNKKPFSPRQLYLSTPHSFIQLVQRTLHPAHSQHIALAALLYIQRYISHLYHHHHQSSSSSSTKPELKYPSPPASPSMEEDEESIKVGSPAPGSEARIWTVGLLVAIKMHDDRAAASRHWSPARLEELAGGGMTAKELADMEREFLQGIQYDLSVHEAVYAGWLSKLNQFQRVMEYADGTKKRKNNRNSSDEEEDNVEGGERISKEKVRGGRGDEGRPRKKSITRTTTSSE